MSVLASRINLLPTARTLATGVPFAPKIAFHLPPQPRAHGDRHKHGEGPRHDIPPVWAGRSNGIITVSNVNGELASSPVSDIPMRGGFTSVPGGRCTYLDFITFPSLMHLSPSYGDLFNAPPPHIVHRPRRARRYSRQRYAPPRNYRRPRFLRLQGVRLW